MSLISTVEILQKRPLTKEEILSLSEFQRLFSIADEDPLIVVLAMMAKSQLIIDAFPNLLQQKANETIELHRIVLRDQSVLIAKELINTLSKEMLITITQNMKAVNQNSKMNADWKTRLLVYSGVFIGGFIFALLTKMVWQSVQLYLNF